MSIQEVSSCQTDDEDRTFGPLAEVLDKVEERRLRPVDVVERDHYRALACQRLEQPAHGPEGFALRGGGLDDPNELGDALGDGVSVLLICAQGADAGQRALRGGLAHALPDRGG